MKRKKSVEVQKTAETPKRSKADTPATTSRRLFLPKCGKAVTDNEFFPSMHDGLRQLK